MKNISFILCTLSIFLSCKNNKTIKTETPQKQITILKGKVHKWVSDSVYISHLPFHSAHSSFTEFHLLSKDSTFQFQWENLKEPIIISVSPLKSFSKTIIEELIYENLTEDYFYSECLKFIQNGNTIYLINPNTTTEIEITANTWVDSLSEKRANYFRKRGVNIPKNNKIRDYGKSIISFINDSNNFNNYYFQDFFELRNQIDEVFDSYGAKNFTMAIAKLEKTKQALLLNLKQNKDKFLPFLYQYYKSDIEYSVKKELLKYLTFRKKAIYKEIVKSGKVPEKMAQILAFDRDNINPITLKTQMYNEYVEFYINFVMNLEEKKYIEFRPLSIKKINVAFSELPSESAYYYISNHLLNVKDINLFKKKSQEIISRFPQGELNEKLKTKFKIE